MSDWNKGWPDWQDDGKKVEVECEDGSSIIGKLCFEDFSPGPDESPYWQIELEDGKIICFASEQVNWKFTNE